MAFITTIVVLVLFITFQNISNGFKIDQDNGGSTSPISLKDVESEHVLAVLQRFEAKFERLEMEVEELKSQNYILAAENQRQSMQIQKLQTLVHTGRHTSPSDNEQNEPNAESNEIHSQSTEVLEGDKSVRIRRQDVIEPEVAFSVYLNHFDHLNANDIIKLDRAITNYGNGYSLTTGIFTAPRNGVYFFTFTIHVHHRETSVALVKNGQSQVVSVVSSDDDFRNHSSTNSVVVYLAIGDRVWLKVIGSTNPADGTLISDDKFRLVTLTGFRLF